MTSLSARKLRPYQREIASAVLDSIFGHKGLTFTVEIARQGGKNELSAQLELLLLTLFIAKSHNLVKCSPTFKPQTVISMMRLRELLNEAGFNGIWRNEQGYIIRLGNARAIFLSAEEHANVVGNTAHLLLEVDEAQDVDSDKYSKEFRPMGATTNVTTVLYGTTWDEASLLEQSKQTNLELERKDGVQRHFRYDWEAIARYNPAYRTYVEAERERLGENHPLFRTQYRLLPVQGGGRFFDERQKVQLQGTHQRKRVPDAGKIYVAGIDIAGEDIGEGSALPVNPHRDATVVTIGEVNASGCSALQPLPQLYIVEQYAWTGIPHTELYARLTDLLKRVWNCRTVVIDATGLGQPIAAFLRKALGLRVHPYIFTAASKSALGFNLLAAVNSGRVKMYRADTSPEYREFWHQTDRALSQYRPNRTLNFFVNPSEGHDDYLMSLALMIEAGQHGRKRSARGS